ncbi:ubiquitin carboxyl-terminal hydrolase 8-like isoform X1 [Aristolochia californica]|uniref:ubiquitin carboxyl-terminal hydrolase 8-like isoform X1 n=1 Tax=Aristolochia californica TaxID=171875 RepID=UPI0035DF3A46
MEIDPAPRPVPEAERVYLVPHRYLLAHASRWLQEAQESNGGTKLKEGILYTVSSPSSYAGPMKIINNFFNSDLVFNLTPEEDYGQHENSEEGVSGRDYALVSDATWLQTLKWHSDSNTAMKSSRNLSVAEDGISDVYPLQLRLSVLRESNQLNIRISKKLLSITQDNAVEFHKRACKIFGSIDSEPVRVWDLSGQTNMYLMNNTNEIPKSCQHPSDQEILLKLQVYGLSDSVMCRSEGKKDESTQFSTLSVLSSNGSFWGNGSISDDDADNNSRASAHAGGGVSLGLIGLQNLGNTCFMNSAIQCLAHTPELVDFFLGDYSKEINQGNPLGMDGELALVFGELLRKLWAPGRGPFAPRQFKSKLAQFAPQFSGFYQHDSQELLAFLLDGLHEDLNRVKCKPYIEAKDSEGHPDEVVANEYWANHLSRNDSIIVDLCQGQYRSTLVCPICNKVSVTFDPFMYLSLPLPSTTMRTMTITVFSVDGSTLPTTYTVTVPKNGKCKDLIQVLSISCSLRNDESLIVAEIYTNRIIRFLEEPSDSLSLIRDDDRLVAYRVPSAHENSLQVIFMHQRLEELYVSGKLTSSWKAFGVPLLTTVANVANGADIRQLFLRLMDPFLKCREASLDDQDSGLKSTSSTGADMDLTVSASMEAIDDSDDSNSKYGLEFYLTDEKGSTKLSQISMNKPIQMSGSNRRLNMLVCWSDKTSQQYAMHLFNSLPEVFKSGFFTKRPQETVSLYACLEAFLKEEPLGPEDMWYCPSCKKHRQASKKLDLWRLPKILVIHLKRFSYSRYSKNKLETFVDFPIHDLDLSKYIAHRSEEFPNPYVLYAVSNHYGSMGSGHYTAFAYHKGENQWFDFDDSHVFPVVEDKIKTSAAYVLFYRRVEHDKSDS